MSKRGSLLAARTVKPQPTPTEAAPPAAPVIMADPPLPSLKQDKATTVHMKRSTWLELDGIAKAHDTSMHALLIEGLKLVFEKYGRDPGHVLVGSRPPRKS